MDELGIPADAGVLDTIRIGGVLTGVVVLAGTWFAVRILTGTLTKLGDRFAAKRLILAQVATLSRFLLYLLGLVAAVAVSIQLSKEVILALTGTAAVTIGFALKDLAASVLAGVTIIIDRPFQVGDRVTFGSHYGEITDIGLRSVRLVTLDDNVITIPNNKFLTEVVSSANLGALDMLIETDFFIGIDQDVELAKGVVTEAITSSRYAYLKKPWTVGVAQVVRENYFALRVRSRVYVLDVKYENALQTDVTERVMGAFRKHGIQPPAILHRNVDNVGSGVSVAA
jgi:small-conductance mechanosensitive channel